MPELFQSIVEEVVKGGLTRVLEANRIAWLLQSVKNWDFYNGNQIHYLKPYPGESSVEYASKKKCPFNYTKLVVNEYIEGVYQHPVRRTFSTDTNNKIIKDIGEKFQFDPFFRKVQQIAEVSKMCGVIIRADKTKTNIYLEAIAGEFIKIYIDNKYLDGIGYVIIAYKFDNDDPNEGPGFRVEAWSRERVIVIEKIGKKINVIFNEENELKDENGLPFIPITFFKPEDCINSPYGQSDIDTIVEINNAYNGMWMDAMRTVQIQQFSLLVVKRPVNAEDEDEEQKDLEVAPTRMIELSTEKSDAKYITPNPAINESLLALKELKKELLDLSRVPIEVISGGGKIGVQSAATLRVKSIPLDKLWEDRKASYGSSDIELHRKIILFNKNINNIGDTNDLVATIDYSENAKPMDVDEQQKQETYDMRVGLTNPVELMLKRDPDMGDKEDALKRIKENKKITEEILGTGVKDPEESVDDFLGRVKKFRQVAANAQDRLRSE